MKRTESYTKYWERQISESERRIEIARGNLTRIALQSQLQLFELPEAMVIPFRRDVA